MDDVDFFDRSILAVLKDGEPKKFQQILYKVGFSHNTLRSHLDRLVEQGIMVRSKSPHEGPGRHKFTYSLSKGVSRRVVSTLIGLDKGLVVLPFERLFRLCRHEKGGYCKQIRGRCTP